MGNPLARLFSGKKTESIEDFSGFVSFLARRWDPAFVFRSIEIGEGAPTPDGEARLLFGRSDRAAAVVVGPAGDPSALAGLTALVRAALTLTGSDEGVLRVVSTSAAFVEPEYRDYRAFASEPEGLLILFDFRVEEGFQELLASYGPKDLGAAAAAGFSPEAVAVPAASPSDGRIFVTEPRAACASRLLFPSAVQAGTTSIRFTPRSFGVGPPMEGAEGDAWYKFGIKTEAASFSGFWAFSRPDSMPEARFPSLATSLAKAAGAALTAEYVRFHLGGTVSSAAAQTTEPTLAPEAVFTLTGSVAVGSVFIEVRVIVPTAGPLKLASLCGLTETDALSAILTMDRVLSSRGDEDAIDVHAFPYRSETAPDARSTGVVRFIPFHESLSLLSEDDYRRLVQNFLLRRYKGDALAGLFYYRKAEKVEGGLKTTIVRPQAFDLTRFVSFLPETAQEDFIAAVREGASAETADDFILQNEGVYEAVTADLRRGVLDLGYRAGDLLDSVYVRYVYPRKRRRLDALIEKDYPFSLLRALPSRTFRAVVDGSDFGTLAAALVGREGEMEEIARWCSARKLKNIREELERITRLLSTGEADIDGLCDLRTKPAEKAEEIQERDRLEREADAVRRRGT